MKHMGRPRFTPSERTQVWNKTGGRCFHCKIELDRSKFHIDHHPVPFKDIEDNLLCCGVQDPRDMDNLQPSCVRCNTSHQFEPTGVWCGRSQMFVSKSLVLRASIVVSHALCFGGGWAVHQWITT